LPAAASRGDVTFSTIGDDALEHDEGGVDGNTWRPTITKHTLARCVQGEAARTLRKLERSIREVLEVTP